jgi:pilus assembly protein CpaE
VRKAQGDGGGVKATTAGLGASVELARSPAHSIDQATTPLVSDDTAAAVRPLPARKKARLLIGIRDLGFHQEVLSFLERDHRLDVIGSVTDPGDLPRQLAHTKPEVTVLCPLMARELLHPAMARRATQVLLVAEEMTVPVRREAIETGAQGVYAWPEERFELAEVLARSGRIRSEASTPRGRVIAVYGARGGAGATFVATHLAGAMADRGERTVVVDLDPEFADLTVALGVPYGKHVRTIADLAGVAEELAPDHLQDVLYQHHRGFSALLGPMEDARGSVPAGLYPACVALLAGSFDVVVALAPRALDPLARAAIRMADDVLLVVTLDLFALYGAKRAASALQMNEPPGRCRVVINRAARSDVTMRDVERILGMRPGAVMRFDPAVRRAQDRGQLLPLRARRVGRDVKTLARMLIPARERSSRTGA